MSPEQRLIRTMVQSFAEIIERQVLRFENQGAEYERKLAEHRASFAARTGADEKIIEGMRSQVQDMRAEMERLRAQMSEPEVSVVGIINERNETWERFWAEVARLKPQIPKHPVKVGEWVVRTAEGAQLAPIGTVAQVVSVADGLPDGYEYMIAGGRWHSDYCEPCDPPATIKREPTIGDTVRLVTHPERAKVAEHLQLALQWPWIDRWGVVGQTGKVVKPLVAVAGAVVVALDGSTIFARWPIACLEVVSEANHDTEAGKAVAESAVRTDPMCVGDEVEVVGRSAPAPGSGMFTGTVAPIGTQGIATMIHGTAGFVELDNGTRASIKDVRKVTT